MAEVGDVLAGRYQLRERLGEGGTATVFRADDLQLTRVVAIKMFGDESALSGSGRRKREARMLAQLRHPAIVTIFDACLDATPPYLVLEYVEGESLADRLRRGALSVAEARAIAAAAASGLAAAHWAGIVHRDVKPANILIPRDVDRRDAHPGGNDPIAARLVDFGIAHSVDGSRHTTAGSVMGSASYLSPEQALGHTATGATDVYSLGLVLIEAILGRPAFTGTPEEVLGARLVRSPDLSDPELAADAELLGRMTALSPTERPTAEEAAEALGIPGRTRVLPAAGAPAATAATAATEVLPSELIATERLAQADRPDASLPPVRSARRPAMLRAILGLVAGLVALAVVVGFAINAAPPAPTGITTDTSTDSAAPTPTGSDPTASDPPVTEPDGPGNGNGNDNGNGPGGGKKEIKKPKHDSDRP